MNTLLIGLDGASPRLLEDGFERGDLPTLEALWDAGVGGTLRSQIPPWTASAWPSLYTGTNPGKHGVFGFLDFDGYDWSVVDATSVRTRTIWEYLDYHGLASVVVNVPVTHPPQPFDGALVPGYAAPEDPACHPEGLLDDVREAIGDYRVYAPADVDGDEAVEWFRRLTRMRSDAFTFLVDEFDPVFGFVQFQQTDTVFHRLPDDEAAVRSVYREVDARVADVIDAADPDTVVVASDHGMGTYDRWTFRVNDYLAAEGFLSTKRGGRGMPTWVTVRDERLREGDDGLEVDAGFLGTAVATAARLGLTTERVAAALEALGVADLVARYVPGSVHRAGTRQVDFRRSRAYARDRIELGVRINLDGREPDGVVPAEEYESVRRALIEDLGSVTAPDGRPVFEEVVPREAYFHGPAAEDAVDLVTVPNDFQYLLSSRLEGDQFGPVTEPWDHKLEGVVVAYGAAVDATKPFEAPHLLAVAPTVLACLGVPTAAEMDGDVLPFVEAVDERAYPAPTRRGTVGVESTEVEDRLAKLGYIEKA